jgi:hypothetical protein
MNDRMNKSIWSGVFFPADEPALVDIAEEEGAPLDETIEAEAVVETQPAVETPKADVEETVVEETSTPEEPAAEVIEPEAVEENAEETASTEENVEAPATEVSEETSAE